MRVDPFYNLPEHKRLSAQLRSAKYPAKPLGDRRLIRHIIAGRITPISDCYSDDALSSVFIRAQNVEEGFLRFDDCKRLTDEAFAKEPTAILEEGDVILTVDGALLGLAALRRQSDESCCISNHMVRLLVGEALLPDYLSSFLNCGLGQSQIKRGITGSAIPGIRSDAIERIMCPLPPLDVQRVLVSEMDGARASRKAKLGDADALLAGLDAFLFENVGLIPPQPDGRLAFAMALSIVGGSKQIGADYFHPERLNAMKAIQRAKKARRAERLEDIADFHRDVVKEFGPEQYLGLAGVQSETGELANTTEDPGKGQSFRFREHDVLFARLRPYLNKVWHAERSGVCSTEFHVIRIKDNQRVDILPGYLAAVLRSSVVVAQTKHMMTGNTHPRLANDDVVDLFIPIPDINLQQVIVDELRRRRLQARRLREEAGREWAAAKTRFEAQLLGEEAV